MAKKVRAASGTDGATTDGGARLEPDLKRAFDLVMNLMPIPGRSGEEAEAAKFVIKQLRAAGVPAKWITQDQAQLKTRIKGNTGNLIVQFPGTVKGPRRLLTAHLDTVPICVGCKPKRTGDFVRSTDRNTGLGADNRAGCAVLLNTAIEIHARKLPHPPLTFCWFIQEEVGLYGARFVQKPLLGKPQLAFNWDGGSATKLTVGATGGYRMEIDIAGIASHAGGAPEKGVSAIAIASLAIADLHRGGWHGDIRKPEGIGTSNVGVIQGGEATNVVTDKVRVRAEARSHDPVFRQRIIDEIVASFERAAQEVKNVDGACGKVAIDGRLDYESFKLADDQPCVLAAEQAVRDVGLEPIRAISNGGLDANWLTVHGIPSVTLGCGQVLPHTVDEALDINEFHKACRIGLKIACG